MKRIYFKRLFFAFLFATILPICLCVAAISYGSFHMSRERYQDKVGAMAAASSGNMRELLEEYEKILNSLSEEPALAAYLAGNDREGLGELVRPLQTGRDNRLRIRVIDPDDRYIYPDSRDAKLYDPAVFGGWGILHEMTANPDRIAVTPSVTRAENGRKICMNIGKAVRGRDGTIAGYVVLDVYRNTLLNAVKQLEDEKSSVTLADRNDCIILDTTGRFTEGATGAPGRAEKNSVAASRENAYGLRIYAYYNIEEFNENSRLMIFISLLVLVCMAPLAFLLAAVFANRMYRPIDTLVSSMNLVTRGNLDTKIEIRAHDSDEMRLVSSVFNWMIARIQTLIENAREESERKKNAELKALQAQISPHFLYNMLNEINALARMGRTGEVSGFVIHLGKLLRRSITFKDDFVKLSDDLVFVEDYIRLQQIRYDQLFDVDIRVEEEIRDCLIPNLIIQPLVENAIIHGFTAGKEGYMLSLRGYRREEDVCIEIYDNGIGVDKEYLKYINNVEKGVGLYGGLGVENVQKRLLLIYGMRYGIKMESEKGRYTKVVILLPYRREQVDKT